jgi:hypothetical protein
MEEVYSWLNKNKSEKSLNVFQQITLNGKENDNIIITSCKSSMKKIPKRENEYFGYYNEIKGLK